jgi:hypothetical protein
VEKTLSHNSGKTAEAIRSLQPRGTLINKIAAQLDLIDEKLGEGVSNTDIAAVFGVGLKQFSCALRKARERNGRPATRRLQPPRTRSTPNNGLHSSPDASDGVELKPETKTKTVRQLAEEMKADMQFEELKLKAFKDI